MEHNLTTIDIAMHSEWLHVRFAYINMYKTPCKISVQMVSQVWTSVLLNYKYKQENRGIQKQPEP